MKDNTLFEVRTLIAIVVVVGTFTGWNLLINRNGSPSEGVDSPIEGMDRFEGYGFSIDYPSDMSFEVISVNESMGELEGMLIGKSIELIGFKWATQQSLPSHVENTPEDVLDYHFILFEESFLTSDQGEIQTGSKDGHDMKYQTFITYGDTTRSRKRGYPLRSTFGAWYCEEAGKYLLLYVAHMPEVSQPNVLSEELESIWQEYLDSLKCH